MASGAILTLNAGSTSIKCALYDAATPDSPVMRGAIERIGCAARLALGNEGAREIEAGDHAAALRALIDAVRARLGDLRVVGVGHRIVHGGAAFVAPCPLDDAALAALAGLTPLAPLHQPHNLAGVEAARAAFPEAAQIGCFDTAFHQRQPEAHAVFALPGALRDSGLRRYGFHGLSYDSIAVALAARHPETAAGRVVAAHLGGGASVCALEGGRGIACSMGATPLDGLVMATRCGRLDPGVVLQIVRMHDMNVDRVERLLYYESGLKGLAGTADMRALLAAEDDASRLALSVFMDRAAEEVAAMAVKLGGLDALVFSGGVGENAAAIRAGICARLGVLGVGIDRDANEAGEEVLSAAAPRVLRIAADEEGVIARAVAESRWVAG